MTTALRGWAPAAGLVPRLWAAVLLQGLFTAVLLPGFSAAAAEPGTITLRDEVYVRGPKVLLGDVALVECRDAAFVKAIELAPAALPGNSKRLDAALLVSRLEHAGVNTAELKLRGARRVLATTLHLEITREMISESLRDFVQTRMPWDLDQTIIEVRPPAQDYVVRDGEVEFRWRRNPQYNYLGSGVFRGEILVDGNVARSFYGRASVETYGDVVVAATDLSRGDLLTSRNLRLEKRELSTLDSGAFFSLVDLQGFVAKSTIFPGQVVTARRVMRPDLVKRNQVILVETAIGSLTIRTRARALADAVAGDLLTCRSLESREEFAGILRRDSVVVVE